MSFGEDTFSGFGDTNPTPSASSGYDYSLGGGYAPSPGLTAPDQSNTPGFGFSAPGPGLQAPGYDLSGGIGSDLGSWAGLGDMTGATDYGLSSLWSLNDAGYPDASGVGFTAVPSRNPAGLGVDPNRNAFSAEDPQDFWGSKAQKALSFFSQFNPVTSLINGGLTALNSKDPVRSVLQGLLGKFGGAAGQMANAGYNVATAKDPMAAGLGLGGAMLGGQLGGAFAGAQGAQLGSSLLGGALSGAATLNPSYGPYGSGSVVADTLANPGASRGASGGAVAAATSDGGGRNWTDSAMSLASGIYGLRLANAQRDLANQAIGGSAPWTASGGNAVAGEQLKKVIAGDFTGDAGFEAAQKAAARAGSQQPGGFSASAAAQAALKYQNDRIGALGGAAGVGFNPGAGYQTAVSGASAANGLASSSLGSLGFGASSGASMPPWLQAYLVKNGMGGTANG
jgi:hypothetical protein